MNIKKAKTEIKNTVLAYLDKDEAGQYRIPEIRQRPILLMGPPGIGKTQIMQQIAGECQIGLVSYTITHHTRQSAIGLPFITDECYDGRSCKVTEYTMSEIIASVYNYIRATGRKEGILFIDEINCVSETLAPTILQFLQCKTFGSQAVPKGWIIVAAGNPPEYNKSVREFDFVTLDRIRIMNIEADLGVFKEYARSRHLHPFILSYLELRPQNFYRTENDVDGLQFVTARGWEDLSCLITSYEHLGIPVDEDVIGQYLQHADISRDAAAYYDLYQKYRDDYDISSILKGRAKAGLFERLYRASFDEKLSCVELLVSGLHAVISEAMELDRLTDACYRFLKEYRQLLSDRQSESGLWSIRLEALEKKHSQEEKTGLVTPGQRAFTAKLLKLLRSFTPDSQADPEAAFASVKSSFEELTKTRSLSVRRSSSSLEHAFTFMEEAFGEDQEMIIFVTELTMDPEISAFISENGCERYYKYNKSLLIGTRRAELLAELSRDEIYSHASSWEF